MQLKLSLIQTFLEHVYTPFFTSTCVFFLTVNIVLTWYWDLYVRVYKEGNVRATQQGAYLVQKALLSYLFWKISTFGLNCKLFIRIDIGVCVSVSGSHSSAENKDINLQFYSSFELILGYVLHSEMITGPRDLGEFSLFGYVKSHATFQCYDIALPSIDTIKGNNEANLNCWW
jgi:hypothetical protein